MKKLFAIIVCTIVSLVTGCASPYDRGGNFQTLDQTYPPPQTPYGSSSLQHGLEEGIKEHRRNLRRKRYRRGKSDGYDADRVWSSFLYGAVKGNRYNKPPCRYRYVDKWRFINGQWRVYRAREKVCRYYGH